MFTYIYIYIYKYIYMCIFVYRLIEVWITHPQARRSKVTHSRRDKVVF